MGNNILEIIDFNFGNFKANFIDDEKRNILHSKALSNKEVAEYVSYVSSLSKQEKRDLISNKINTINKAELSDQELEKEIVYTILLLKSITFTKEEADAYWSNRYKSSVHKDNKKVLIEIAAMHPLINGKPGKEFEEHLEQGIELYNIEKTKGNTPIIYVPGSTHYIMNKETNEMEIDAQPLAEAGREYLLNHGIKDEDIRANATNIEINGDDGVYNSADECYVATEIAKKENIGRIISVVSPVQLYRKALFYYEFGYNPELYSTGTEKTGHNYIGELFWSLYISYMNDQDWQSSFLGYLTRKERDSKFLEKAADYQDALANIQAAGPGIPENVLELKKQWLETYNASVANMTNDKKGVLIDLIRTANKDKFELERLENIIKDNLDANITILCNAPDIEDINKLISKYPNCKLDKIKNRDTNLIAQKYLNGDYKKFFGMYPSSICMKEAVHYINDGIIPIVSSLPEDEPNYVVNISEVFDFILNEKKIDNDKIKNSRIA